MLHLGFWLIFVLLLIAMAFVGMETDDSKQEFLYYLDLLVGFVFIPSLCAFYTFYYWLFPKYLQKERWWASALYGVLISIGAAGMGLFFLLFLSTVENSIYEECIQQGMIFTFVISLVLGFIAVVIRGFITWFEEIQLKAILQQKNQEMELALVKAQLDPHFLFNTLNNIDVLMLKNAEEASNYLNKLSDIMRFMLFETKTEAIPLAKEVEYIEKYIELQKLRTANTDYVHFSITGDLKEKTIAPMVFIPFIENAFKHTNNKKLKNAIRIAIKIGKETIQLFCENKFDPNRKTKTNSNGLGNDLIQKRLNLIYPERHQLNIAHQKDSYRINLIINHG